MLRFQLNIDFYLQEEVACKGKKKKRYQDLAEHSAQTTNIKPKRKMEKWGKGTVKENG